MDNLTNQVLHSLLQKAVRRGHTGMVNSVLQCLLQYPEQQKWLRNRLAVITTEECWPYIHELDYEDLIYNYNQLTLAVKDKDAAGLGSLALALKNKAHYVPEDTAIVDVAELLQHPADLWRNNKLKVIRQCEEAYKKCSQECDKATVVATAYLAMTEPVSVLQYNEPVESKFPIWVAFDKHTGLGSDAIIDAAKSIGVEPSLAFHSSHLPAG
jgi:hypothetical protein